MLTDLFPRAAARFLKLPLLGACLDGLAGWLAARGLPPSRIRRRRELHECCVGTQRRRVVREAAQDSSRLRSYRRFLRPCNSLSSAPAAAAPPCPPRRRGRSARVALRTRRVRRLPPPANAAGDDSADTAHALPPPRNRRFRPGPSPAAGNRRPADSGRQPRRSGQ